MKYLKHFGAAGTVTGSCHLLVGDNDRGTLIDFGMFQGPKEIVDLNKILPSFDASQIDNVILTHAHLDHCGRLPLLYKMGFAGKIFMTPATRDLAEIVMYDSAKIAQSDPEIDPLYTDLEVEQVLLNTRVVNYKEEFGIGNYKVVFKDAGHLLGSAFVELTDTQTNSRIKTITFSGDLGNTPDILLRPTESASQSDVVVLESTYGDRIHPDDDKYSILTKEINKAVETNSVLMIPAFSLERTQLLLYMIKKLKRDGKVNANARVFMDSPMGITATHVYRKYVALYNEFLQKEFNEGDPFTFSGLQVTRTHKQSKRIHKMDGHKIIIAGSGMMSGGRIVSHAAKYLPDDHNTLLFVGYQGVDTMGRAIREGAREVEIDGTLIPVNAHLSDINNMSAHADQTMLLNWVSRIENVKKVVLVHGEDNGPRETLSQKISQIMQVESIYMPQLESRIDLL